MEQTESLNKSVHTQNIEEVYEIPMKYIIRPIQPQLDEEKVKHFMDQIQVCSFSGFTPFAFSLQHISLWLLLQDEEKRKQFTPVDILWVETEKGNYYYCFGGCHRFEAHKRLGLPTIRAKVMKTEPSVIRDYMGSSSPF
jgi:sulfiredoxin